MESDLRVSLIAGATASALSALVGLFSRVGILALLFRALIMGLFIGGLAFGAFLLIRRFLPELFLADGGSAGALDGDDLDPGIMDEGPPLRGSAVDIVLDDEGVGEGQGIDSETSFPLAGRRSAEPEEEPSVLPLIGGAEEELEEAEAVDAEPVAAMQTPRPPSPSFGALPGRVAEGVDDLDVLPDLETLTGSFADSVPSSVSYATGGDASGDSGPRRPTGKGADGADPAALALAVRTLLKRDQKG